MPITGPSSYLETTDEFLEHWDEANTELGAGNEVAFADGTNRATLVTKRALLVTKRTAVTQKKNDEEFGRGDVETKKTALLARFGQFTDRLRGNYPDSKWVRALPEIPNQTDGQATVVEALEDVDNIWAEFNADPANPTPITVAGAYTRMQFRADVDALIAAYKSLQSAGKGLEIARERRNDVQDEIYPNLKNYRQVFPSYFVKGHALIDSLPRLSPEPGATPAAVTINAAWDGTEQKARVTFNASSEPNVDHYSVRYTIGLTYSSDDEIVIDSIPAGPGPFTFFTDASLAVPGDAITIKVFTVNDTQNERGSNAVTVIRPAAPPP